MGRWWNIPQMAEKIGINSDQKKKMDDNFQQYRLKLIDLNATLQKAEMTLEPLMNADQPDEAKIVGQIDRVAQAADEPGVRDHRPDPGWDRPHRAAEAAEAPSCPSSCRSRRARRRPTSGCRTRRDSCRPCRPT